jgi:hypothetical protein
MSVIITIAVGTLWQTSPKNRSAWQQDQLQDW